MINTTDLAQLSAEIHEQNVFAGWWNKPRTTAMFFELFHSELSEGLEGIRKNLMDDKLPHHQMFKVELADYVIRVMDYLGQLGINELQSKFDVWEDISDADMRSAFVPDPSLSVEEIRIEFLATTRVTLAEAYRRPVKMHLLARSVMECFWFANFDGWDLLSIIQEKREFNRHRDDHKLENRAKENGKKF